MWRVGGKTESRKGFTIVELMVAVGIVMVLALLVIPNVWRARVNSNESAAVSNLRSLNGALQLYYINNNTFPRILNTLIAPNSDPAYIETELASGTKTGYTFSYVRTDASHFYINANPQSAGRTGNRYFYIDETGVVRSSQEGEAGEDDTPLQ